MRPSWVWAASLAAVAIVIASYFLFAPQIASFLSAACRAEETAGTCIREWIDPIAAVFTVVAIIFAVQQVREANRQSDAAVREGLLQQKSTIGELYGTFVAIDDLRKQHLRPINKTIEPLLLDPPFLHGDETPEQRLYALETSFHNAVKAARVDEIPLLLRGTVFPDELMEGCRKELIRAAIHLSPRSEPWLFRLARTEDLVRGAAQIALELEPFELAMVGFVRHLAEEVALIGALIAEIDRDLIGEARKRYKSRNHLPFIHIQRFLRRREIKALNRMVDDGTSRRVARRKALEAKAEFKRPAQG